MFHSPPTLWGISTVPGLLENFLVSVTPKWRIPTKKDVPQTAQSQEKKGWMPKLCKITFTTGQTHMMTPQLHRSAAWSYFPSRTFEQTRWPRWPWWTPQPHLRRYVERCTSFGGHRLAGRADIRNTENWKTSKNRRKGEKLILWKILKSWHLQPNYKFKVHLTSFVEVKGAVLTQESRQCVPRNCWQHHIVLELIGQTKVDDLKMSPWGRAIQELTHSHGQWMTQVDYD